MGSSLQPDVLRDQIIARNVALAISNPEPNPNPNLVFEIQLGMKDEESNPLKVIQAHQFTLKFRSSTLAALIPTNGKTVPLPNVNSLDFERFHSFLATHLFPPIPDKAVIPFLKLCQRYIPQELDSVSANLMTERIKFSNVYFFHLAAEPFNLTKLREMTTDFIARVNENPKVYLSTADFLHLEEKHVAELLMSNTLQRSEIELFKAVLRWGKDTPSGSGTSLKDKLYNLIGHIRFPLMTANQFIEHVDGAGILSVDEEKNIYKYFLKPDTADLGRFSTQPRVPPVLQLEDGEEEGQDDGGGNDDDGDGVVKDEELDIQSTPPPVISTVRSLAPPPNPSQADDDDTDDSSPRIISTRNQSGRSLRSSCTVTQKGTTSSSESSSSESEVDDNYYPSNDEEETEVTPVKITVKTWPQFLQKISQLGSVSRVHAIVDGDARPNDRVTPVRWSMPCLKKVLLDLTIPTTRRLSPKEVIRLRADFDPEPYIFFNHNKSKSSSAIETLFKSGIDFELLIKGCKFIKVSPSDEEVIIGFGGPASSTCLEQLARNNTVKNFKKLGLVDLHLSDATNIPRSTFKDIILWGVYDDGLELGPFLRGCTHLTSLTCWAKGLVGPEGRDKSCIDLKGDLTSGNRLVKLDLCCANIILGPSAPLDASVIKSNLTELRTDYCHWSPRILENFDKIFPNLEKLVMGYCVRRIEHDDGVSSSSTKSGKQPAKRAKKGAKVTLVSFVTVPVMWKILKLKKIQSIRIFELNWDCPPGMKKKKELEKLLNDIILFDKKETTKTGKTGIKKKNDKKPEARPLPNDFLLTKSRASGMWEGEAFVGRDEDETHPDFDTYYDAKSANEYEAFRLNRIFRTYEDFDSHNTEF